MHEVLSFFTRSSSPDRVKEKGLCALCDSVVKKILTIVTAIQKWLPE